MNRLMVILNELKRDHHYCDDDYYSCPKREDSASGASSECDCGADEANTLIDEALKIVRKR